MVIQTKNIFPKGRPSNLPNYLNFFEVGNQYLNISVEILAHTDFKAIFKALTCPQDFKQTLLSRIDNME